MKARKWMLGAVVGCAALVAGIARADFLEQDVRGKLVAVDTSSGAKGTFRLESRQRDNGTREIIVMNARHLGATPDQGGDLPSYHAVLIDSTGTNTIDFGAVRLNSYGQSYFRFDSRFDSYPAGVSTIRMFGGGKFELQRDGAAVLRGDIHEFVGLTDVASRQAWAHFHGRSKFTATINGGAGRGTIQADMLNNPTHVRQNVQIEVRLLGTLGNPFAVVALDGQGGETTLGTITTRGRRGHGALRFFTRRGDEVPAGGIPGLVGKTIEVRNSQGTVVLTGVFPSVPD
jgi:hypothetical protein